jgi:predicted PurR-regulated permease PerM
MTGLIKIYLQNHNYQDFIPANVDQWMRDFLISQNIQDILNAENVSQATSILFKSVRSVFSGSMNIIVGIIGILLVILYLFFILLDYKKIETGWQSLITKKHRPLATSISGMLNIVPYLQVVGFIPALFLALLKAMESSQSFGQAILLVALVMIVVQIIQETILIPKIMGKAYDMNPALILLSLSVWGSLMGVLGMLLALPLTTVIVSYYKQLIVRDKSEERPTTSPVRVPGDSNKPTL